MDEPKLHHAQVNIITDDWGDKQEFHHIKSPWPLMCCKTTPYINIVNLRNAAEEGFEQCHYVLPR